MKKYLVSLCLSLPTLVFVGCGGKVETSHKDVDIGWCPISSNPQISSNRLGHPVWVFTVQIIESNRPYFQAVSVESRSKLFEAIPLFGTNDRARIVLYKNTFDGDIYAVEEIRKGAN